MQPLKVRTGPTSPIEAEAIDLLRSIDRYQPPSGQKQRVRKRLLERSLPHRVVIPRFALVAAVLLIAVGASAAFTRHLWSNSSARLVSSPASPASAAGHTRASRKPEPPSIAEVQPAASASVTTPSISRVEPAPRGESPSRASASPEKVLVFDAMRALRREGHPERAAKLLEEYLRRYPSGSLSEEALALSIEAATALSDPKAKLLAERYLTRYPSGRFRAAAERARAKFSQ